MSNAQFLLVDSFQGIGILSWCFRGHSLGFLSFLNVGVFWGIIGEKGL